MTQTAALYHLQTLDSQLDRIHNRLAEIDRLLGQNEAVKKAQAALKRAEDHLQSWQTRQTDLELERGNLKEELDTIEERLYSGRVHNPRELTDLQSKLTELRRRHASLEDPILEAMVEIDDAKEIVKRSQGSLDRVMAEQAGALHALTEEKERLIAEEATLKEQVGDSRAEVERGSLALYDSLRKKPGGIAVVLLNKNAECGGCGVQITSSLRQQVRHGVVTPCPTCGRVMYSR